MQSFDAVDARRPQRRQCVCGAGARLVKNETDTSQHITSRPGDPSKVSESKWTIEKRGCKVGQIRDGKTVFVGVDTPIRSCYDEVGLSTHRAVIT